MRREIGGADAGMLPVSARQRHGRRHLSVKDWLRRLGWFGLWLIAQRCMRLWLADLTVTGSKAVALTRRHRRQVEEPPAWARTIAVETTRSGRRSCSHGSS
jgi:hypothetical protein